MLGFLSRLFKAEQNEPTPVSPSVSPREFFTPAVPVFSGFDENAGSTDVVPLDLPNYVSKRLRFSLVADEAESHKAATPLWKRLSLGSERDVNKRRSSIGSTLGFELADINGATERLKVRARAELEEETRQSKRFSEALQAELHKGVMEIPLETIQSFEADARDRLGLSLVPADAPLRKKPRLSNLEISTCEESRLPELSSAEQRLIEHRRKSACVLNPPAENPALFTFLKPRTPVHAPQPAPVHAPQPALVHAPQPALPAPLPSEPVANIFATSFETSSRRPGKRR